MADVAHSTTNITGGHTAAVAGVSAGFISAADQTKLNGIEAGAREASTGCFSGWGDTAGAAATTAEYYNFGQTSAAVTATENTSQFSAPFPCTITGINHWQNTSYSTDTVTDTMRVNGVDTAVLVALTPTNTTAAATGFAVAVNAGDIITIKHVQSGSQVGTTYHPRVALTYTTAF